MIRPDLAGQCRDGLATLSIPNLGEAQTSRRFSLALVTDGIISFGSLGLLCKGRTKVAVRKR
ncbi:MAG: hypothetical protein DWQ01_06205 [Planctomycetota bacterium]|nr:MAG: hypothetical protein DWQ01_06205 [Planctomycetota bacterium]